MQNFITKDGLLFYCYTIDKEQHRKIDAFLSALQKSGVEEIIRKASNEQKTGRPRVNPYLMFAAILFGFAFGSTTLRALESSCRYDTRFIYIMGGEQPDYSTFSKFFNRVILPHADEIFAAITKTILSLCNITIDDCHIDGTKFEARSNKYKVVWKPTTFHLKLSAKVRGLLSLLKLSRGVPNEGFIPSSILMAKIKEAQALPMPSEKKERKTRERQLQNLTDYLLKLLEYEEKESICGTDRNSYYKTDHDATAMCLKEDYYSGLGSNLRAAYQMQVVVCHGFVVSYYVSQDRTDLYSFIPTLNRFHTMHGALPERITADAGYGCLDNYRYCQDNGIEAFVKYQSWEGECSGRRPALYELNNDNSITCLGGLNAVPTEIEGRHHKLKNGLFYRVHCPEECPFMPYCRQWMKIPVAAERVFEINPEYQRLKQQARDRLLSVKGIELRVNRSCQVEGVYGIAKYNMQYNRIRRAGMNRVKAEFMLILLGLNVRKLFRCVEKKTSLDYWKAPEGLQPEKFKKPSAKRLANRVRKRRNKQPNEIARDSYRHKSRNRKRER